jgi:transcription elongation factor GreA
MTNYITKEGLNEIQKELEQIQKVDLIAITDAINKALAEGDLKENAGLDSAKLDRDRLVARENEILELLNDYDLIEESKGGAKTVKIGGEVTIKYLSNNATFNLKIVGSSEADAVGGKISNESPLAVAILGKKANDETSFKLKDKTVEIKITDIIS